jgi:hypothetical protein
VRRPILLTVVPILSLGGAIGWAVVQIRGVEARGEPELHDRAVAWEKSLSEPGTTSPLEFIHPEERSSPQLRRWLPEVARLFANARTQILQTRSLGGGEGETTYALDEGGVAGGTGTIGFRWVRAQDGVWYVVPRYRESLR